LMTTLASTTKTLTAGSDPRGQRGAVQLRRIGQALEPTERSQLSQAHDRRHITRDVY
jgi:hypothetical protein